MRRSVVLSAILILATLPINADVTPSRRVPGTKYFDPGFSTEEPPRPKRRGKPVTVESDVEKVPMVESLVPEVLPADADPLDDSAKLVLAKEKTLTPTLEDGVNDEAVFGQDAAEVTILDAAKRRVFHARRDGTSVLRWDCRGPTGKIVDAGVYSVVVVNRENREYRQTFTVLR